MKDELGDFVPSRHGSDWISLPKKYETEKASSRGGVGAWREANAILESHKLKTNYARLAKKKKKPVG